MHFIKCNFLASTIVVGDKMIEFGDTCILIFFTSASVYAASTCMGLEKVLTCTLLMAKKICLLLYPHVI